MTRHALSRLTPSILLLSLPLALASCGPSVDDPANLAKLGNWTVETKLNSISVNGVNIGRGTLANEASGRELIEKVESKTDETCVEPSIHDDDAMLTGAGTAFDACQITDSSISGASRHAALTCTMDGQPVNAELDMTFYGESGTSRVRATVSKPLATGGADRVSIIINQSLTRTGDCS